MRVIQVVPNPTFLAVFSGDLIDDRDEKTVEKVSDSNPTCEECSTKALHVFRGLVVEELEEPNCVENVSNAEEDVLWQEPKDAHGDDLFCLCNVVGLNDVHPSNFYCVCNGDGYDLDDEADA